MGTSKGTERSTGAKSPEFGEVDDESNLNSGVETEAKLAGVKLDPNDDPKGERAGALELEPVALILVLAILPLLAKAGNTEEANEKLVAKLKPPGGSACFLSPFSLAREGASFDFC